MYSYNKNKKKLNYMILIIMILVISIGYAVLNTNLNIVGTGTINNPTWNIHWENVQVKTGSVSASTPTIDTAKTTVNYSVTLTIPGEYYEFTVDAVNAGTIDGMVSVVSNKLNGTEITTLPNYLEYKVSYVDDIDIGPNHLLASGTSEKYKVHVSYKKDINVSDIPATPQTLNLSFSVTYVQSDTNVAPVPHPQTVYTVNLKDTSRPDKNYIRFNQVIPESITQYSSAQDVMAANGNKPFYLKHKLIDNVVTESYIEFVITEVMANNNPGLTAGTYAIRGLDTWDDVNNRCKSEYYDELNDKCNSIYYEYNKNVLQNAFGTSYCNEYEPNNFEYYCSVSNLEVYADSEGAVSANGNGLDCGVYSFGASYC